MLFLSATEIFADNETLSCVQQANVCTFYNATVANQSLITAVNVIQPNPMKLDITKITFENCSLTEVPFHMLFEKFKNLYILEAKGCNITSVGNLKSCSNLETLNLSNNTISEFPSTLECGNLKFLNLSNNPIKSIDIENLIVNLENLKILDLRGNLKLSPSVSHLYSISRKQVSIGIEEKKFLWGRILILLFLVMGVVILMGILMYQTKFFEKHKGFERIYY